MVEKLRWVFFVSGVMALQFTLGEATSLIPPRSLGDLALGSQAVVLAVAGDETASRQGGVIVATTLFAVDRSFTPAVEPGQQIAVTVPGGVIGDAGWLVPGVPRFHAGETYLLFLSPSAPGVWQPRTLAWGVLHRIRSRTGEMLLAPLPEAGELTVLSRPEGAAVEVVGTHREDALLDNLRGLMEGRRSWDARASLATPGELPLTATTAAIPQGCNFLRYPDTDSGLPLRWSTFDQEGSVTFFAEGGEDPSLEESSAAIVAADIDIWMGTPGTSLDLRYGGTVAYPLTCSEGRDLPQMGTNIVIFDDPCGDIPDLVECSGTLAIGGPWFSGTHSFDGATWNTIQSAFTIINNATGCLGVDRYTQLVGHELGHGLGLAHSPDPNAMMHRYCCNPISPGDIACVQYLYPAAVPAMPEAVQASDGTFTDRVHVSWTGSSGATVYEVWRGDTADVAGATLVQELAGTSWDDTGTRQGVVHFYWVRAKNALGASAFSAPDSGFTASCTVPASPSVTSPATVRSGAAFTVSWQGDSSATVFEIQEATKPSFTAPTGDLLHLGSTTFSHTVERSSLFYYRARGLTACGQHQVASPWSPTSVTLVINQSASPSPATRFDFGTDGSPVAPGFTRVTPDTLYSPTAGYGWSDVGILARDRGLGSDITRDLNFAPTATFLLDLPNGIYEASLTMGDALHAHDLIAVFLEDQHADTVSAVAGQFVLRSYPVTVTDGQLAVTLQDLGGADQNAVISGFTVTPLRPYRFDFGTASSPLATGYVQVAPGSCYTTVRAHGWLSGAVGARDRGRGSAAERDFNFATEATFAVDVPSGSYDATVWLGDAAFAHDEMGILLEAGPAAKVTTAAGGLAVETARVTIGDGQLSLLVKDLGGSDGFVVINALDLAPSPAPDVTFTLPGGAPMHMVRVPAGTFAMGSPEDERGRLGDESPQHAVTIPAAILAARHEVTHAQWNAVMGLAPPAANHADLPITLVSWDDIAGPGGFLDRLNHHLKVTQQAGAGSFRLPTEAEWEWAARAGAVSRFSFGDSPQCDDSCGICAEADDAMWWCGNSGNSPHPVAAKLPNAFGLYDMNGNVQEWVDDVYTSYGTATGFLPADSIEGGLRTVRGGAFDHQLVTCRAASRQFAPGQHRADNLGFRVVVSEPPWLAATSPANARMRRRP